MNKSSYFKAALIAGVAMALLSNLSLLNFVNCILCLWIWVGGALAVYLYRRFEKGATSLSPLQAAGLGAVAGVIGAVLGVFVYAATSAITTPLIRSLAQTLDMADDLPFAAEGGSTLISTLIFFVMDIILYPLFGALGAFLTETLMSRKAPVS